MGQKERNKATEVVDGVVETVDVSKHPTASIEPSDLSLADIERRKSHPVRWILFMALVLLAMIAPYWWGRDIAVRDASWMVANLNFLDPKGVALISWTVTIVALTGLGLMVADAKKWLWGAIFVIGLAAEQFVAGMCLLSFNFWNATYVMYGEAAGLANAANLASSPPVSVSRSTRCSGWACWCASRRNRSSTSSHAAGPRSYCSSQSNSSRLPWCCSEACSRPWRDVKNGRRRGTGNIGRRFWSGRRVRCSLGVFRPRIESASVLGRQHRAAI